LSPANEIAHFPAHFPARANKFAKWKTGFVDLNSNWMDIIFLGNIIIFSETVSGKFCTIQGGKVGSIFTLTIHVFALKS
jgi:hypothetical protein